MFPVISVVGAGKIGEKHARILGSMPDVTLGLVVDADEERAERVASAVGTDAGSLDEALRDADCLFVCTPDDEHTDIALHAIDRGLHTFVEKPLATSTDEAEMLETAAEQSDGVHAVGHVLRFDPRYRAIRDTEEIGEVISVVAKRLVKRERLRRTGTVSRAPMRLGVHDFDLLEWITGTRVRSLETAAADGALADEGYDVEETVSVIATLRNGATATLTMGFCLPDGHPGSIVDTVVVGTDGTASVDASGAETQLWDRSTGTAVDSHLWPEVGDVPGGALASQDRAFVDAMKANGESPVPFAAGKRAVTLATAVERSIDRGTRVDIET